MGNPLEPLTSAAVALVDEWNGALPVSAETPPADANTAARAFTDDGLMRVADRVGKLVRLGIALQTACAAEIAARSRRELGAEGLASAQGFASAAGLIASLSGGSHGDATRLVSVGEATSSRPSCSGRDLPSPHPLVSEAFRSGVISVNAADSITAMLDRAAPRCSPGELADAEALLVEQAAVLSVEMLARMVKKCRGTLDPGGVELQEEEMRDNRSLIVSEQASGMLSLKGTFDPTTGAPIKAAIEAMVATEMRRARDAFGSSGAREECACGRGGPGDGRDERTCSCTDPVFAERRTMAQMRADALSDLARHGIGCEQSSIAPSHTVVVRGDLDDLVSGVGSFEIDGIDQPISAHTARCIASTAGIIPAVFGGGSLPLDLGRRVRHFSPAQRLALAHRDGGCAFPGCTRPPAFCEAHHKTWWTRDKGPTDLDNGVLLCSFHHHRVHGDGWQIDIVDGRVWFIPPADIDPTRTPRPGNNVRRVLDRLRSARKSVAGPPPDALQSKTRPPERRHPGTRPQAAQAPPGNPARASSASQDTWPGDRHPGADVMFELVPG